MEKKIKLELTESELNSIIYCLDLRAAPDSGVADEWRKEYSDLANKLDKIVAAN